MKRTLRYYQIIWMRHDLSSGLAVFLVALPLCLGIALASGAPLYTGLLSGIIGGILVSIFSGSALAVSGPAAGLSTLVAASIISLGNYSLFLPAIIIAGLFQVILGLLKLGVIANFFPSAVIKGMLAAIGIILISKQIPLFIGYGQPDFWTSGFLDLFISKNILGNLSDFSNHISAGPICIAVASVIATVFLQRTNIKKLRALPIPLFIVLLGIGMNSLFNFSTTLRLNPAQLVNIPLNIFSQIVFPNFSALFSSLTIWKYGIIIGLLASLETLLCIEAIDKLDKHNRITPLNKELVAQGIGNIACGFLGAIPLTAVVVRGAANIDAGAKTKLSAITHGLFLLIAIVLFPTFINKIPYASLSVILMSTGYNLTKSKLFFSIWKLGLKQFLPFLLTVIFILSTDLLLGVCIGLLLSIFFIVQNNFKAEYKITKTRNNGIDTELIKLNSNVTFLNKYKLKKTLDEVPKYSVLTIDGSESHFIDYDILEIISEFEIKAQDKHIELHTIGIEKVSLRGIH